MFFCSSITKQKYEPITGNKDFHHIERRHDRKDYSLPGIYHITINVNHDLQQPLGKVVGNPLELDESPYAPKVVLTKVEQMVEQELTSNINRHCRMIRVQDYVVITEHLHVIFVVKTVSNTYKASDCRLKERL